MTRRLLAGAALLLAACSSSTPQLGGAIRRPAAVAFFDGVTTKLPGQVHRYMAVAAFGGDELRIVDPADDKVVVGPGLVFPLSVPTAPGPVFLAAADLGDTDAGGGPLPGLLAVAGQQAPAAASSPLQPALRIEIVATWQELTTVAPALAVDLVQELSPVDPAIGDAQLLSLAALPVPGQPGRAAVVAGLSGGRLAVVTYERDPASAAHALRRVPGLPARLVPARTVTAAVPAPGIPFDPLDLALEPPPPVGAPGTTRRLFAATADALGDRSGAEVHGVAEITAGFGPDGSPAGWAIRGLDALAPTRLVAAQYVAARDPALQDADLLETTLHLQVFAVLDEAACGPHFAIGCGVATLVPDDPTRNGIAADPVGELPYRVPIYVPGYPLAMTAAAPPYRGGAGDPSVDAKNPPDPATGFRVMTLATGTGNRDASAVVAVASASGVVTMLDPSRFSAGNDVSQLRGTSRAGVLALTDGGNTAVLGPAAPLDGTANTTVNDPILVLWNDRQLANPDPVSGLPTSHAKTAVSTSFTAPVPVTGIEANITATPGYAQDDSWSVRWQGTLPGLSLRQGVVGRDPDGTAWVAAQARGFDSGGSPGWISTMDVTDPELGVHSRDGGPTTSGDTVVIDVIDPAACPSHYDATTGSTVLGQLRATVLDFLPPSPAHPGGALKIDRVADPDPGAECPGDIVPVPPAGAVATTNAYLTVRGSDAVVTGGGFGYAGRARVSGTIVDVAPTPIDNPPDTATIVADTFALRWEPEAPLQAIAADPAQPAAVRRDAAERLAIARKARRNNYPNDNPCGAGILASDPVCADWKTGWNPILPATDERVVLKFRLAVFCRPNALAVPCTDGSGAVLPIKEDTGFLFTTQRGVKESTRRAPSGGSFPRAISWIDKSVYGPDFSTQIVTCFTDDQVATFPTSSLTGNNAVTR